LKSEKNTCSRTLHTKKLYRLNQPLAIKVHIIVKGFDPDQTFLCNCTVEQPYKIHIDVYFNALQKSVCMQSSAAVGRIETIRLQTMYSVMALKVGRLCAHLDPSVPERDGVRTPGRQLILLHF